MKRKKMSSKDADFQVRKSNRKFVVCSTCNVNEVSVDSDSEGAICWLCCQKMVEIPHQLKPKEETEDTAPRKPRGWRFMKVYVDAELNVYHKGVEQPELKGTLPPTVIEEKKKLSSFQRQQKKMEHEQKLAKRYEKKKEQLEKKKKREDRKQEKFEIAEKDVKKSGDKKIKNKFFA